jgi:hypothetical protein
MDPKVILRKIFIRELRALKNSVRPHWLLIGDFNLIYKAQDKNNGRLNRGLMLRFRRALNHMEVQELDLKGGQFTWSNNQTNPTLTRIDRAFCTPVFENLYNNLMLQPLSSSILDHCPLLLMHYSSPRVQPIFRFEARWPKLPGFLDFVEQAWNTSMSPDHNPLEVLHIKLSKIAKALRR